MMMMIMRTTVTMMVMVRWWVLPCVHITVASSSFEQTVIFRFVS